jgi:hypothetical protein
MCVLRQRNASIGQLPSSITNLMSPLEFLRDIARGVTVKSMNLMSPLEFLRDIARGVTVKSMCPTGSNRPESI